MLFSQIVPPSPSPDMESRKTVLMNLSAGQQCRHRHREQTCHCVLSSLLLVSHQVVSDSVCDPLNCNPSGSSVRGISPVVLEIWGNSTSNHFWCESKGVQSFQKGIWQQQLYFHMYYPIGSAIPYLEIHP